MVLPVRHSDGLAARVGEYLAAAARYFDDYELILVGTRGGAIGKTLARVAATHWPVSALTFIRPHSLRFALREGWRVSRGQYILSLDQNHLASGAEVGRLLAIAGDYDAVFGFRHTLPPDPLNWALGIVLRARGLPTLRDPTLRTFLIRADLRDTLAAGGLDIMVPSEVFAEARRRNLAVTEVAVTGAPANRRREALRAGSLLLLAGGLWMLRRRALGAIRR